MKPTFNNELDYQIFPSTLDSLYQTSQKMEHGGRIFCTAGEATIVINDTSYHLNQNASIAILPYRYMQVTDRSEDFQTIVFASTIEFSIIASKNLKNLLPFYYEHPLSMLTETRMRYILQLLKGLQNLSRHSYRIEIALNHVRNFLLNICHIAQQADALANKPQEKATCKNGDYFNRFNMLLAANCMEKRNVDYYAQQLAITPELLNKICQDCTGLSTKRIIDLHLIALLKHELHYSGKPLQEIAHAYHFTNTAELSRYFKRITGHTPSERPEN